MALLSLKNIDKTYESQKAVDGVSLEVPEGSIFGLLGPNGAGKTTLIRIITNIIAADEGEISFDGQTLTAIHRQKIGYMPEERGLYKKMKVGEQLLYLSQLKGLSAKTAKQKIDDWLEKFEITDWWNKKISDLSKGMQQKIQFIATVVHEPQLLILDEPFSGLDPINTNLIKSEIDRMCANGATIIFSTHRMEQVEEICDDIALINKGKNILEGKVAAVKQQFKQNEFHITFADGTPDMGNGPFEFVRAEEGGQVIRLKENSKPNDVLKHFINQEVQLTGFNEILPSLNEIFIRQVQESADETLKTILA